MQQETEANNVENQVRSRLESREIDELECEQSAITMD
jgi:hypothetical protein